MKYNFHASISFMDTTTQEDFLENLKSILDEIEKTMCSDQYKEISLNNSTVNIALPLTTENGTITGSITISRSDTLM